MSVITNDKSLFIRSSNHDRYAIIDGKIYECVLLMTKLADLNTIRFSWSMEHTNKKYVQLFKSIYEDHIFELIDDGIETLRFVTKKTKCNLWLILNDGDKNGNIFLLYDTNLKYSDMDLRDKNIILCLNDRIINSNTEDITDDSVLIRV